jgi:endo-alpha-1,4-polygalactosaminidase (GH114 family)
VGIVEKMRKAYPENLIVQNRGFALLNQSSELIDAVMFENFSSWYNFDKKQYEALSGDPSSVMSYHERGLVVLCMDYANPDQTDLITRDFTRAKQFGFIPYVATILLDKLFIANP